MNYLNKLAHNFDMPLEIKVVHKKEKDEGLLNKLKISWRIRKVKSLEKQGHYDAAVKMCLDAGMTTFAFYAYCRAEDHGKKIHPSTEYAVWAAMGKKPEEIEYIMSLPD